MVVGGCRWFQVVPCFSNYAAITHFCNAVPQNKSSCFLPRTLSRFILQNIKQLPNPKQLVISVMKLSDSSCRLVCPVY